VTEPAQAMARPRVEVVPSVGPRLGVLGLRLTF